MYELRLVYIDGSVWFAGGFSTQAELDAWVAEEKNKPYWNASTQLQTTYIPPKNPNSP